MTIKAVIFDLDGTVTAFNLDYRTVRVEVRSFLITSGIPPSTLSINESIFEMLKKAEIFLRNAGKSESKFRKIREEALAIAEKHEFKAAQNTRLLPGVLDTLKTLKKMNMKIGLCTINSHKSTEHILNRFRIKDCFDTTTPRDKVKYVKPNTEHLRVTVKALKVKPREAVVVGDGGIDMHCARELGVLAVGLPTEISPQQELINSGANYLITAVTDLPMLIEHINKEQRKKSGERDIRLA